MQKYLSNVLIKCQILSLYGDKDLSVAKSNAFVHLYYANKILLNWIKNQAIVSTESVWIKCKILPLNLNMAKTKLYGAHDPTFKNVYKYKDGNNRPSSVNQISLVHNHNKSGNKCYTHKCVNRCSRGVNFTCCGHALAVESRV